MSKPAFQKFINVKPTGAKKKEKIKQEKRAVKKERAEYFDNIKREQRKAKKEAIEQKRLFEKSTSSFQKKSALDKVKKNDKVYTKERVVFDSDGKPKRKRLYEETDKEKNNLGRKSYFKTKAEIDIEKGNLKIEQQKEKEKEQANKSIQNTPKPFIAKANPKPILARPSVNKPVLIPRQNTTIQMPLNKYIAHCGICSRRDAAMLVQQGKIKVNNKIVLEPGYKIQDGDSVSFDGKTITTQKNLVYILLNKPKDFLTTADDPQGRKTVMDLIAKATNERVYPIGRLDRNTTGVLLFTNDGDLAQKLTHPKHEIKKIYEVKLDKPLTKADAEKILGGLQLEDGIITPDALAFVDNNDKSVIGIEIHSGKNRIVRRIFEHLGYEVKNLDRVMFANLTKKNVERGRYRFLTEKEIRNLKFLNASKK